MMTVFSTGWRVVEKFGEGNPSMESGTALFSSEYRTLLAVIWEWSGPKEDSVTLTLEKKRNSGTSSNDIVPFADDGGRWQELRREKRLNLNRYSRSTAFFIDLDFKVDSKKEDIS